MSGRKPPLGPIERATAAAGSPVRGALLAGALVAAILVVLGTTGTWTQIESVTINGFDADDGLITFVLGIVAAGLLLVRFSGNRRVSLIAVSIAFDIIAFSGVVNWLEATRIDDSVLPELADIDVSAGWGLQLATVAGIIGAVLTVVAWWLDRHAERWAKRAPRRPAKRAPRRR